MIRSSSKTTDPTNKLSSHPKSKATGGVNLTMKEIRQIVEIWSLPPFVALEQAADIANLTPGSLRGMVSEGRFPNSAVKGKPLMFVTVKFVQEVARRTNGASR